MGLEERIEKHYDDLMSKLIETVEIQTRLVGENKELKREVTRLREVVLTVQKGTEDLLLKVDAVASNARSSERSFSSEPAEPPVRDTPREPTLKRLESSAKSRSLKEFLAEGLSLYDVKVLNGFINSTKEVIKANCRLQPAFVRPMMEDKYEIPVVVAGKMKLTTDAGQGAMALAFEKSAIEKVVRSMLYLPDDQKVSEADCKDVTSELCNQVCGRSKALLRKCGYNFNISVPTVMADQSPASLLSVMGNPKLALSFQFDSRPFYVLLW